MDVAGALRRTWWLVVALGVVGVLVGVVLPVSTTRVGSPVSPALAWQARTLVGTAPGGGGNQVAGDVTAAQIQFYGSGLVVETAAAKAAGLDVPTSRYPAYFSAVVGPGGNSARASGTTSTVVLTARGRTRAQATSLAHAYADQLGKYLTFLATTSAIAKGGSGTVVAGHTGYQVLETPSATLSGRWPPRRHVGYAMATGHPRSLHRAGRRDSACRARRFGTGKERSDPHQRVQGPDRLRLPRGCRDSGRRVPDANR